MKEPNFLGVSCTGKNSEKAKALRDEAQARLILAGFYDLDRREQLILAAMATEMTTNRGVSCERG